MGEIRGRVDIEVVVNDMTATLKSKPNEWASPEVIVANLEKFIRRLKALLAIEEVS